MMLKFYPLDYNTFHIEITLVCEFKRIKFHLKIVYRIQLYLHKYSDDFFFQIAWKLLLYQNTLSCKTE